MRPTSRFLAALVTCVALPLGAQTIDTRTVPPESPSEFVTFGGPIGVGSQYVGQTFVVPVGATYLQDLTFYLRDTFNGAALRIDGSIYALDGFGVPTGPALFTTSATRPGSSATDFEAFSLGSRNVQLTGGASYVALLSGVVDPLDPTGIAVNSIATREGVLTGQNYAGGTFVFGDDLAALTAESYDAVFTATFTASAVPEPATLVLVAGGLALVAVGARTRRS